jgi:hypothetical protein
MIVLQWRRAERRVAAVPRASSPPSIRLKNFLAWGQARHSKELQSVQLNKSTRPAMPAVNRRNALKQIDAYFFEPESGQVFMPNIE